MVDQPLWAGLDARLGLAYQSRRYNPRLSGERHRRAPGGASGPDRLDGCDVVPRRAAKKYDRSTEISRFASGVGLPRSEEATGEAEAVTS